MMCSRCTSLTIRIERQSVAREHVGSGLPGPSFPEIVDYGQPNWLLHAIRAGGAHGIRTGLGLTNSNKPDPLHHRLRLPRPPHDACCSHRASGFVSVTDGLQKLKEPVEERVVPVLFLLRARDGQPERRPAAHWASALPLNPGPLNPSRPGKYNSKDPSPFPFPHEHEDHVGVELRVDKRGSPSHAAPSRASDRYVVDAHELVAESADGARSLRFNRSGPSPSSGIFAATIWL